MKKIVYYFVLFSIVMLSTAVSCKKSEIQQELPTGVNTMYYYIDGELYLPKGRHVGGIWDPAISYGICSNESFDISTINLLLLFHNGIQQIGEITLNQSHYDICQVFDNHAKFSKKNDEQQHINYYTHDGSGSVNITYLSEDKRKFIGTFEMTVYHESTNQAIQITDGHFNINLDTLND